MQIPLRSILWRKLNRASLDSLLGVSTGQYHIALPDRQYVGFFAGLPQFDQTARGGFAITVLIQPFTGPSPVPATQVTVSYLGDDSARRDWNIRSQRPDTAYPLWRQGRGFVNRSAVGDRDFIIIARDINDAFHARWIRTANFPNVPDRVRNLMSQDDAGWSNL